MAPNSPGIGQAKKACGWTPSDLRSYAAAAGHLGMAKRHERGQWRNNRARIRINRPDDENARCRVSRVRVQPKNFSQPTQSLTTLSTSNAISPPQKRTEPSGPRRCRRGATSSLRREPNMPADLLRALFGNVTVPLCIRAAPQFAESTRRRLRRASQEEPQHFP